MALHSFKCVAAISVHFCINRHFNYIKVLPFIIKYVGIAINKITRMGRLESYFDERCLDSQSLLTIKDIIPKLSRAKLYAIATSGMSAVSMAMLGSYMQMIEPKFVVTAVMLNILVRLSSPV